MQDEARQQAHPLTRGKGDFRCCLTSCDQGSCATDSGSSLGFAGQLWPGPPTLVHFLIFPDLPWQVRVTAAFDASPLSYISVPQSCLLPSVAHCQGEYQGSLSSCVSCLSSTQNVSPWWGGLLDPEVCNTMLVFPAHPVPGTEFSSVAQSCPTLCDPMNCSSPGLPVHHQLPEFTQTHVH